VEIPSDFDQSACTIPAASSGYIQAIDYNLLTRIAESKTCSCGSKAHKFVVQGTELVKVWPGEEVNQKLIRRSTMRFFWATNARRTRTWSFRLST
jgi:uncharacterized membrane protein